MNTTCTIQDLHTKKKDYECVLQINNFKSNVV